MYLPTDELQLVCLLMPPPRLTALQAEQKRSYQTMATATKTTIAEAMNSNRNHDPEQRCSWLELCRTPWSHRHRPPLTLSHIILILFTAPFLGLIVIAAFVGAFRAMASSLLI
ncbi:hypothetical protein RIF29_38601 [Crotalaria pallida]|uniref:Uncharacterized protein n=1 Tax=Crotalaria pallida TaxID=3830 RepID=A0AAN9E035_CROPI